MTPDVSPDAAPPAAAADQAAPRIVIAGLGLLSPLGHTAWATFQSLLSGRTLAERAGRLPASIEPVSLVRALGGVSLVRHVARDPTVELAERAARQAAFAGSVDPRAAPLRLGTSKGAVTALAEAADLAREQRHLNPEATGSDAWLAGALGPTQYLAAHVARRLGGAMGPHHVAACASSLTALHHAREALARDRRQTSDIRHQTSDMALVVTADAALLPMFVHSYRRLGVLADLTPEGYRQRPLDQRRGGFMLSEAGAAVLLKRLPPGEAPKPGQIELVDTALATEAHDLVRPSPTMDALRHVAERLMGGRSIDMIHPHAPGTAAHDPTELGVYSDVLADNKAWQQAGATNGEPPLKGWRDQPAPSEGTPALYACKGALGHSLGAAGLSALVLACLCLKTGRRPPMPWLEQPIDAATNVPFQLEPPQSETPEPNRGQSAPAQPDHPARPCDRRGAHAVFAAGFGGHTAGAVIQRH